MKQYIDKSVLVAEIKKLKGQLLRGACSSQISMQTRCKEEAYNEVLALLDIIQEEPVSEDLEEAAKKAATQFVGGEEKFFWNDYHKFKAGANWQKQQATNNNIWHSIDEKADGKKFVVLYDVEGGYMSPPSRSAFGFDSDFINAMNKKYGANYTMWAYKDDLTPKKED